MQNANSLLCIILLAASLFGCKNEEVSAPQSPTVADTVNSTTPISPVGTAPAGPSKEAPATTSNEKSEVSKTDQSASMPLAGQAGDHSAIVPKTGKFPKSTP